MRQPPSPPHPAYTEVRARPGIQLGVPKLAHSHPNPMSINSTKGQAARQSRQDVGQGLFPNPWWQL